MSDWEIRHLQNQIERLENKINLEYARSLKESSVRFIWLMIISNILFWFCVYHLELSRDFKQLKTALFTTTPTKNDISQKNKS